MRIKLEKLQADIGRAIALSKADRRKTLRESTVLTQLNYSGKIDDALKRSGDAIATFLWAPSFELKLEYWSFSGAWRLELGGFL